MSNIRVTIAPDSPRFLDQLRLHMRAHGFAYLYPLGQVKLGSDESFYNLMIYEAFTDLSVAIKRDLQRYCRP